MGDAAEFLLNGLGLLVTRPFLPEIVFARLARLHRVFRPFGLGADPHIHLHFVAQAPQSAAVLRAPALHELRQNSFAFDDRREAERNDSRLRKNALQDFAESLHHLGHGLSRHLRSELRYEATQSAHIDRADRRSGHSGRRDIDFALLFCDAVCEHKLLIQPMRFSSSIAGRREGVPSAWSWRSDAWLFPRRSRSGPAPDTPNPRPPARA